MQRLLSHLRLPWIHKNGVVHSEGETSISDGGDPVEIPESEASHIRPQKDECSQLIRDLEEVEEFVLLDFGVEDVRVSVRTSSERRRFLQIRIRPADRYKPREKFKKLERRLTGEVSRRFGFPRSFIQVGRIKAPRQDESF